MANLESVLQEKVRQVTKVIEEQVDEQIDAFNNLEVDDLENIRKQRAKELKERAKKNSEWLAKGHGEYSEIAEEKAFFDESKKSERLVVQFYRDATFRCKIVDKHLALLAPKHLETKFCKINAEKCPFLCDRLKIKVLPAILLLKNAQVIGRIVGFGDLGNKDDFSTEMMEWRLGTFDIIDYAGDKLEPPDEKPKKKKNPLKIIRGGDNDDADESD